MATRWRIPKDAPAEGDDPSLSPDTLAKSLLAADDTGKTRRIFVDGENNLNVHVQEDSSGAGVGITALTTGTASGITDGVLTSVVSYVVPADMKIMMISCSGDGPADYFLDINTTVEDTKRTNIDMNIEFTFGSVLAVTTGDVITIKILHHATGKSKTFNATIYGA